MKPQLAWALAVAAAVGPLSAHVAPSPALGTAGAACRAGEREPAITVVVDGLKDRTGRLRIELYPDNEADFLADDAVLVENGKAFRRVDVATPVSGRPLLCLRAPGPGIYTLALLHDRNSDRKFNVFADGIGFPGNPRIGMRKPSAAEARVTVGSGMTNIEIRLNYWRGLSLGPLKRAE